MYIKFRMPSMDHLTEPTFCKASFDIDMLECGTRSWITMADLFLGSCGPQLTAKRSRLDPCPVHNGLGGMRHQPFLVVFATISPRFWNLAREFHQDFHSDPISAFLVMFFPRAPIPCKRLSSVSLSFRHGGRLLSNTFRKRPGLGEDSRTLRLLSGSPLSHYCF